MNFTGLNKAEFLIFRNLFLIQFKVAAFKYDNMFKNKTANVSLLGGGEFLFKILDLLYSAGGNPPKYWHPQSSYNTST